MRTKTYMKVVVSMSILFLSSLLVLPNTARCEYPERQIRFIVGMDPGGPADLLARAAAAGAQKVPGQAVHP